MTAIAVLRSLLPMRRLTLLAFFGFSPLIVIAQVETQPFPIIDPVLKMPAWWLALPTGWHAEATMMAGSSCSDTTTPVFRATSADSTTGVYFLPRVDWAWGADVHGGTDCLPVHAQLTAKDYLNTLIRSRHVGVVREEPVPELDALRRGMQAQDEQSQGTRKSMADMAIFRVRYEVAGQGVEERFSVTITCSENRVFRSGPVSNCSAFATRWFAPLGKLDAAIPTLRAMKLTVDADWTRRWEEVMRKRIEDRSREETSALLAQGDLAQEARNRENQAYLASAKSGYDAHNAQFSEHLYEKQRQSDNFVDYVLDCQRAYSSNERISVGSKCPNRQTY